MPISWAATGAMLSGIGTIGSAVAIIGAAILGKNAVNDLREEKRVEREMDIAEKTLTAAYKLKAAYDSIRNPMSPQPELERSEAELEQTPWYANEPKERHAQIIQANVFFQRIRHFEPDFDEALSLIPFVKAYFGDGAGEALENLIRPRHSIRVYAEAYATNDHSDPEHTRRIQRTIWRPFAPSEEDETQEAIDGAISHLEGVLTPVLRSTVVEGKIDA